MDGKDAKSVMDLVSPHFDSVHEAERFTRLTMVNKFNSVTIQPSNPEGSSGERPYYGHGLFEVACRMTHSCRPNCVWFSSQDGRHKIVRLLIPVKAGDILTIS